ncbi:hypothetical protein GDO81_026891 [Engystomops pustulosus]|uniref:Uncharacterized protein n=2 Tax=Engystomops pustulosus TaxID=76066 RepID=A0AAV6YML6_ENGPU|nr:hypothetical protein GDO81_026891 [Engystomops pustulosus]
MTEVREYEKETQAATNEKIGPVAPTITITPESHCPTIRSAPATPITGEPPEFLTLPKERPRKTSAPDTLTLPELRERANGPASNHPSPTDS